MRPWQYALIVAALLALYYWYAEESGNDPLGVTDLLGGNSTSSADGGDVGQTILSALASFENVAPGHNNPGGICGSFIGGVCQGPADFASLELGTDTAVSKIDEWLQTNPYLTVSDFVAKWSGATGQVLSNYTNTVASELGLDPSDMIANAGGDDE
jgi:hypothetical protein